MELADRVMNEYFGMNNNINIKKEPLYDFKAYVEILGVEVALKVAYSVWGENHPATHWQPAEEAEIEILSVYWGDTDICPELNAAQEDDLKEQAKYDCDDQLAESQAAAAEAKADFKREEVRFSL